MVKRLKVEKDIKVLTRGDEKPTYKLVGDEIIVEHTFPTLTKDIKSNVFKVTKLLKKQRQRKPHQQKVQLMVESYHLMKIVILEHLRTG